MKRSLHLVSTFAAALLASACSLTPQNPVASRCPEQTEWTDAIVAQATGLDQDRLAKLKKLRALDNHDICTMPEAKLARAIVKSENPKPDHPGEWAKFRAQQQADENGLVDPHGLLNALTTRRTILSANPVGPAGAGITSAQWTPIGPGNIGGRIRAIAIHPTDANQIWIGSVSGGIWKSNNGGTSWSAVNDFMSNLSISSLVISPTNNSTMYAGTGEGYFNADAVRGLGVFKSTDGGITWNQLSSTDPSSNGAWYYVNRLAVHPTNGNTLLAATNNGIFRTTNGGTSWAQTSTTTQIADIRIDPLNGNNAVATRGYSGGYIMYSTDGGVTWNNSNFSSYGRTEIAYSRTAGLIYASADDTDNGSIYKSTNGGATWTLVKSGLGHLSGQGWYDNTIWVDPTNSNHLITGGLDLYRSTNGGVTFSQISLWWHPSSVHADHHAIVESPAYNGSSNRTVFFGNDGGIYKATDIAAVTQTSGWTNLNNGLAVTQFYSGAGHTGTNGRIIGGTQDNGSLVYPGSGTSWTSFYGGDGGFSAVDPTDGNYIYGEYVYLQIHRSINGGASSASYIYTGISDAGSAANFIAPFALDPNAPSTMYAGGNALWRSTNVKATPPSWSSIQAGTGSYISQIHVAQGNSNVVWFGRNDGSVWKSTNATAGSPSFTRMGSGTLPGRMVTSLLVNKDNTNEVYVGFGGYSTANLWKTTDGGTTWTSIGSSLPSSPVRAVQRHPSNASWLYAGTEVGLFVSENGGSTWSTTNDGPANASVETLTWLNSTDLLVATHGRGMFKTTASATTNHTLSVAKSGTGSGTVTSSPVGINCGATCSAPFNSGTSVTLTATPAAGSAFTGWSGACTGTGTCTVSMSAAQSVTASFTSGLSLTGLSASTSGMLRYQFTVPANASNLVFTTSGGTGNADLYVRLGSEPTTGAYDCRSNNAGNSETCTFPTPAAGTYHVMLYGTAAFSGVALSGTYSTTSTLTVSTSGSGSGTVTSSPAGISCGADCTETYGNGTSITLTATPSAGSTFAGWSGGTCSGTATTCAFTLNTNQSVTATFTSSGGGSSASSIVPILMLLLD